MPTFLKRMAYGFADIFNQSPSWAEFMSCCTCFLYCALALGSVVFLGKPPEMWPSQDLITDLLDGRVWITIAFVVGAFQFGCLISMRRCFRMIAAFAALAWQLVVVVLAWPVVAWSPILAFAMVFPFFNFFAIARHAKDWPEK